MDYFIFFKNIVDMFYSMRIFDYLMMAVASVLFVISLTKLHKVYLIDVCAFCFIFLLSCTFLRSFQGITNYTKMMSAFFLYFIGRGFHKDYRKAEKSLVISNYIVVIVNCVVMVLGYGFMYWGDALTFRGLYFYKSDFAIAMIYAISSFVFFEVQKKKISIVLWILIGYLILRSNTRVAMIIYFLVFCLWLMQQKEMSSKTILRINVKYVIGVVIIIIASIYIVSWIFSLQVFKDLHLISFNFSTLSDLLNDSNTQGRNNVWISIINKFNNSPFWQKIFGVDFISDYYISWDGRIFESHNGYLKILYTTGYVGLMLFIIFILLYVMCLNNLKDRSLFYFNTSILITFLLQSISQSSLEFTQMTWIFMFFVGCAVSRSIHDENEKIHYNKEPLIKLKVINTGNSFLRRTTF